MKIAANIKKLREQRGLVKKQVAAELGIGSFNYHIMERGMRKPSIEELQKLAKLFSITVDELINKENQLLKEVMIENKIASEKVRLISLLNRDDQHVLFRIIDGMLTKKR